MPAEFTFTDAVILFALTYLVIRIMRVMATAILEHRIQQMDEEIRKIEKHYRTIRVEQHADIIYIFDARTDEFMAQGQTAQDFMDRFPVDVVLKIVEGDADARRRFREIMQEANSNA